MPLHREPRASCGSLRLRAIAKREAPPRDDGDWLPHFMCAAMNLIRSCRIGWVSVWSASRAPADQENHLVQACRGRRGLHGLRGRARAAPTQSARGVHGGWALALIDSITACAAHSTLPAGVGFTTIETKTNFSRPIAPDTGCVRAEGRVVGKGRTIISAEGKIVDARGRLLTHGTSTVMVLMAEKG